MLWVLPSEEKYWHLYIGSKLVDSHKIGDSYQKVYDCLSRIRGHCIALSDIKLVEINHPIVQQAIELRDRYKGRMMLQYQISRIGDLPVDTVYIYPSLPQLDQAQDIQPFPSEENFSGKQPILFAVRQDNGSYKALPGDMHFLDGRLGAVSLKDGTTWKVVGSPLAPIAVHLFSDVRPRSNDTQVDPKRCIGWIKRLFFADGRNVGTEDLGTFEVDFSEVIGPKQATNQKIMVSWGDNGSLEPQNN